MTEYAGRKAVITGGTAGIGLAVAEAVVAGGGEVVVTGRRAADRARFGDRGLVVRSDSADLGQIEELAAVVEQRLGRVDLLFVNAGFAQPGPFGRVTEELFDATFGVNAKGAFFTAQRLAPLVVDGGAIVFTTSVANGAGNPGMTPYAGAKAAVRAFTKGIAAELLPRGIRVNAVSPGFIETPSGGITDADPELLRRFAQAGDAITPMRRHGSVAEVARAVLFLAFGATFTTGAEFNVDGGLGLRLTRP
ncbi:SDR family NAD(P)-dependent oxidoreductase [Kitasatospora sp. NPDC006697]|uniref:SDR family NAD(P)-dependent oxidoreductase n=1 Tax=Kitasatospora sp. NPDC006697 TaxID=3364020 RepID=UPI0036948BA0